MKRKIVKKDSRDKKFIGALIGAGVSIVGGLISAGKKRRAAEAAALKEKQDFDNAQQEQRRIEGVNQASIMTNNYADQSYVDEYKNKITLKNGGAVKLNKNNKKDRIAINKKFALGGRKKGLTGLSIDKSEVGGIVSSVAGVASSLLQPTTPVKTGSMVIKKSDGFNMVPAKQGLIPNSYSIDSNGMPIEQSNLNMAQPITTDNTILQNKIPKAKFGKKTLINPNK